MSEHDGWSDEDSEALDLNFYLLPATLPPIPVRKSYLPLTEGDWRDWDADREGMDNDLPDGAWQFTDSGKIMERRGSSRRASSRRSQRRSPDHSRGRESSPLNGPGSSDNRWRLTDVYKRLDDLGSPTTIGACWPGVGGEGRAELQDSVGTGRRLSELPRPSASRLTLRKTSSTFLGESLGPGPLPLSRTASSLSPGEERTRKSRQTDLPSSPFYPSEISGAEMLPVHLDATAIMDTRLPELCDDPRRSTSARDRLMRQLLGQRGEHAGLSRQVSQSNSLHEIQRASDAISPTLSGGRLPDIHLHRGSSEGKMPPATAPCSSDSAKRATTNCSRTPDNAAKVETSKPVELSQEQPLGQGEGQNVDDVQEAVLAVLECPVCRDFLQPPLKQCCNGHVVCFSCWPRLSMSLCPACRAPFIPTASLVLDGVLRALRFPCPNRDQGCNLYLKMDDRVAHDQVCPFRPRRCPVSRCEWQGLPDALVVHCHSEHVPMELRPAELRSVLFHVDRANASLDGVPTIVYHEQRLFSQGGSLFLFQSRYDLWRSKFFAHMVLVAGQRLLQDKLAWEVELNSPDGSIQLRMRNPVCPETMPPPPPPGCEVGSQHGSAGLGMATGAGTGLKLDLDVFNLFMEAGRYTLRLGVDRLKQEA